MTPIRIWLAGLLIALGALGFLGAAGVADAGTVIHDWWPVAIIALALLAALAERRLSLGPLVLLVLGCLLLVGSLGELDAGTIVWPAAAVILGISLLARRGPWTPVRDEAADRQDLVAVLGAAKGRNRSAHFRSANVCALFGGAVLDLTDAHPGPGARVDALALFGGVDVLVPPGWRITLGGLPIFGGYEDKTRANGALPEDAPQLRVVATAIFGGVTTKTAEPVTTRS